MFMGTAAGMAGGGITAAVLSFIIAEMHGVSDVVIVAIAGGTLGVFCGLPMGMLLGTALALYLTKTVPPTPKRFRWVSILTSAVMGVFFGGLGAYFIYLFRDLKTSLALTSVLGMCVGLLGAAVAGRLLSWFMERVWRR